MGPAPTLSAGHTSFDMRKGPALGLPYALPGFGGQAHQLPREPAAQAQAYLSLYNRIAARELTPCWS
jgi:hypothetical protein